MITHRRLLMPLRPRSEEASGDWWLSGGIASGDCTIAFQPKGAADAAASLLPVHGSLSEALRVNLSWNWTADTGWTLSGDDNSADALNEIALFAGLSNAATSWIIKIASPEDSYGADQDVFAFRYGSYFAMLRIKATTGYVEFNNRNSYATSTVVTSAIYACGGVTCYIDASSVGSVSAGDYGSSTNLDTVGCGYAGARDYQGQIHAMAFYKTGLSQSQISALTTAMAAL